MSQEKSATTTSSKNNNTNTNISNPKTLVDSIRNQPIRKSKIGGVLTRQPDYEERHLEMMKYLTALKHGGKEVAGLELSGIKRNHHHFPAASSFSQNEGTTNQSENQKETHDDPTTTNNNNNKNKNKTDPIFAPGFKQEVLHRYHESEVQRLRHSLEGKRRFKTQNQQQQSFSSSTNNNNNNPFPHEEFDPSTGLPRGNIATMNLKNSTVSISPWKILWIWVKQSFSSKLVLILVLGFVVLLNLKRFGVLLEISKPETLSSNNNVQKKVVESVMDVVKN